MANEKNNPESSTPATPEQLPADKVSARELSRSNSPVNRFGQEMAEQVRPGGKVECYFGVKKDSGAKPSKSVKQIDGHWAVTGGGPTPELFLQGMKDALALYFVRAGGQETGPASDNVKDRVEKLFASHFATHPGSEDRLRKDIGFLIAATPEKQPSSKLTLICRSTDKEVSPALYECKVSISNRDMDNLKAFAAIMTAAKYKIFVAVKGGDEIPLKTFLKQQAEEFAEAA